VKSLLNYLFLLYVAASALHHITQQPIKNALTFQLCDKLFNVKELLKYLPQYDEISCTVLRKPDDT
jgi:hypothetical protein